ncbi:MAG: hypothetical protein JRJ87_17570 [Deltaproteobacteria bacterium]|nr:hypothetical protein [Deltaproteobacteria bacterium]
MQSRKIFKFLRLGPIGFLGLLVLGNSSAWASDPLDDTDGTEGWDQVIQPKSKKPAQVEAERNTFKREVADWETIRQLWQTERERYLAEKGAHGRLLKRLKATRRPAPEADITENGMSDDQDWGDEGGDAWMESSGSLDRLIDDELGESGAIPSKPPSKPVNPNTGDMGDSAELTGSETIPSAFKQRRERDTAEERRQEAARAAAKLLEEQHERERLEKLASLKKEEEERRKKEEEARAGEAAAATLLKQQEEEMKKEEEALRKKAKLNIDKEGQVVDPELQEEMNEDDEEEEEEE